jgi:hypothetical protein
MQVLSGCDGDGEACDEQQQNDAGPFGNFFYSFHNGSKVGVAILPDNDPVDGLL